LKVSLDDPTVPINVVIDIVRGMKRCEVSDKYNLTRKQILDILNACPALQKRSRLTQVDILNIRELNRQGLTTKQIADRYRISKGYARMISRGDYFKHIGGPMQKNYERRKRETTSK